MLAVKSVGCCCCYSNGGGEEDDGVVFAFPFLPRHQVVPASQAPGYSAGYQEKFLERGGRALHLVLQRCKRRSAAPTNRQAPRSALVFLWG